MVEIGEHVSPTTAEHPAGIYRVVGTSDPVTLLRVADRNGRRRHTGVLIHVDATMLEASFEPASDPDAGIKPVASVRNALQGLFWSIRRFFPP